VWGDVVDDGGRGDTAGALALCAQRVLDEVGATGFAPRVAIAAVGAVGAGGISALAVLALMVRAEASTRRDAARAPSERARLERSGRHTGSGGK
jgi:hypothetical protein